MTKSRDREAIELVDSFIAGETNRRTFTKRMAGLSAGAMFGGALAGILRPADVGAVRANRQDAAPTKGGSVVASIIDKPVNMDPAYSQLYSSMQVYQNVFNSLIYVDANYNFTPGLAKSWRQVDPLTWEFDLVDNATFHNGEKFTSRDVVYTVARTLDPEGAFPNAASLQFIDKAESDGDYKVRFKLKYPWGSFLAELAIWMEIVNEKGINSADPKLNPIGTGPFKMTEWVQDDHIRLDRWENYHIPDRPYLDTVIFRSIPDDTVRLTGLQTNELQWIQQVPLLNAEALRADESDDIRVTAASPYLPDFLYLNGSKPPFNDARVRQAVALCLDRAQIVQVAYFNQATPAVEVASELSPYFSGQNLWANGPDYEKAKQLLSEAGAEGLTFDFDGQPQVATQLKIAQVIQQQLSQAGMTMNIQNYESGDWITRLNTLEYSATATYYSVTIDPVQFYNRKLRSDSKGNNTGYKSAEMDRLLDAWVQESDVAKRAEAYAMVVDLAQRDAAVLPLDHQSVQYWSRVNLSGVEPVPSLKVEMEKAHFTE